MVTISPTTATVVLSGLTIRNGSVYCTPYFCDSTGNGGGIYNGNGTLTINNSTVSGNVARGSCSYYHIISIRCSGGSGGGIYSTGTLTINNSNVSGNVAMEPALGTCIPLCSIGDSGGIASSGTLTIINNSTVSGNVANACISIVFRGHPGHVCESGGGISSSGSTLTISNSTISGNSGGYGGGIANIGSGTVKIQNCIVAKNPSGGDCFDTMTSHGYNLSSDNTCNFTYANHDLPNTDPLLWPLQYNGAPNHTQTLALRPGSPAIDAGNPSGCTDGQGHLLKTDQRGLPRPNTEDHTTTNTGRCDIGAYELQSD